MIIKAADMKSCFNCQLACVFDIPERGDDCICNIRVKCFLAPDEDVNIAIKDECPDWDKKG